MSAEACPAVLAEAERLESFVQQNGTYCQIEALELLRIAKRLRATHCQGSEETA